MKCAVWGVCAAVAIIAAPALGQDSSDRGGSSTSADPASGAGAGGGRAGNPGPVQPAASTGEVTLGLERFGLGDWARPGEIAAIRISAADVSVKPREVLIRMEGRDPDGDTPLFERQVVLNPGVVQGVWLYPLLPRNFDTTDKMVVSVYEVAQAGAAGGGGAGEGSTPGDEGKLGALLGRSEISMRRRSPPFDGAIGVIGSTSQSYGLGDYSVTDAQGSSPASGHELIHIIEGLRGDALPDRWMGYSGVSAMVWGSGDPQELRGDKAAALREWVQRGGHLIVILPVAGQAWTNASSNELYDLLPRVTIARHEGVDMEALRPLLTRKVQARLPKDAVLYSFTTVPSAKPGEAIRLFNDDQGRCVVARRLVGAGVVTLIGMDLNHRMIQSQDAINADVFWNRVLGKRGKVWTPAELGTLQRPMSYNRQDRLFESDIPNVIAKSGRSATGLLLALVVFAMYWLVAGPGGYAGLKKTGWVRHAWLAFFASAGVFTAIAWGGAWVLRPSRVEVSHLTFLDHVYGQPVERARSWMSVLIPWYGQATVEVGEAPKSGDLETHGGGDVVVPWTSPEQAQAGQDMFPDARGYPVSTKAPRSITFPTRQTVKQLRADWSGGPTWKMPMPVGADGQAGTGELKLLEGRRVEGKLVHELPGALRDVTILVVREQQQVGKPLGDSMVSPCYSFRLAADNPWEPGETLDLGEITGQSASASNTFLPDQYFADLLSIGASVDVMAAPTRGRSDASAPQRLSAIAFLTQFPPPPVLDPQNISNEQPKIARRMETHGWDLGVWFTQPCIIIVGHLGSEKEPQPSPIPCRINGEPVLAAGRTVVRWVYPLPEHPPEYFRPDAKTAEDTATPGDARDGLGPSGPK